MAANKKTIIKTKKKAMAARAKAKRSMAVKKNVAIKSDREEQPIKKAAGQSTRRNASDAISETKKTIDKTTGPEVIRKKRPVNISRANLANVAAEDYNAPWIDPREMHVSEEDTSQNRGRMLIAMLVATLLLGVLNSTGLLSWVRGLPAGPVEDRIIMSAETWHEWMEDRGLDEYMAGMRKLVETLKEVNWQDI